MLTSRNMLIGPRLHSEPELAHLRQAPRVLNVPGKSRKSEIERSTIASQHTRFAEGIVESGRTDFFYRAARRTLDAILNADTTSTLVVNTAQQPFIAHSKTKLGLIHALRRVWVPVAGNARTGQKWIIR